MKEIEWIFSLKKKVPIFLKKLKGKKRKGFYKYSLSGDIFGENIKWGLANSVFFLKIMYTLNLEKEFIEDIKEAIEFILSFRHKNGNFYDPLILILSYPFRIYNFFISKGKYFLKNKEFIMAETRQSLSSLKLFNINKKYDFKLNNEKSIKFYLKNFNWNRPWSAGSYFSHLLFFLKNSNLERKEELIDFAINWVNRIQHKKDGCWYTGNPNMEQKINGAMKIISGLKAADRLYFKYPEKIIDNALLAINDIHACDNFNIVYVLKYCNELTKGKYRYSEIKDFIINRLKIYKEFYFENIGGFSFFKGRANSIYNGAYISKGKKEPDIHGTVLFLWGISIISQILNINYKLKFKEFIT
ncbi:MAG: hypothetical protein ACP6IY_20405 [Promethearchaeia archaeon]